MPNICGRQCDFCADVWYDFGGLAVPPHRQSMAPNCLWHSAFPKRPAGEPGKLVRSEQVHHGGLAEENLSVRFLTPTGNKRLNELIGFLCMTLALLIAASLF